MRHPQDQGSDTALLLNTLGRLWLMGVGINWHGFYTYEKRHRVPLPTYPFERQYYWIETLMQTNENSMLQTAGRDVQSDTVGDIDVALPSIHARPYLQVAYVAPRNDLEEACVAIWQQLFGVEQIGVYDNFFELGGHSLLATKLVARLREIFSVEFPMRRIFETPTVAMIAEFIEELLIEKIEALPEVIEDVE